MKQAALLYWFPQANAGPLTLGDSGLAAVPEHLRPRFATHTKVDGSAGPDPSRRGLLITCEEGVAIAYDRTAYTWRRVGAHWAGIRNDYASADFARHFPDGRLNTPGYDVVLGDGRRWRIPVALADAPHYAIPWRETLDDDGRLLRQPDPHYAQVCQAAGILYRHISADGEFRMDEDQLRLACANAIAVNYRLDLDEILLLGLLTSESYRAIVGAILDLSALEDLASKKAPGEPGIGSGAPDSSDTTTPPGPTLPG